MNLENAVREEARVRLASVQEWLEKAHLRITIEERANVTRSKGGVAFVEATVELPLAP